MHSTNLSEFIKYYFSSSLRFEFAENKNYKPNDCLKLLGSEVGVVAMFDIGETVDLEPTSASEGCDERSAITIDSKHRHIKAFCLYDETESK